MRLILLIPLVIAIGVSPAPAEARLLREFSPTVRRYIVAAQKGNSVADRLRRRARAVSRAMRPLTVRTSPVLPGNTLPPADSITNATSSVPSLFVAPKTEADRRRVAEPAWSIDARQAEVLRLTNREREKEGQKPLVIHGLLQQVAERYARDMSEREFFSHRSPDGDASLDRIRASGYLTPPCDCSWSFVTGENIARGQETAEQVVRDWMQSPSHRANILHPAFTEIGIGFSDGYWTQEFGTVTVNK